MCVLLGPSIYAIVFLRQWRVVRLTPALSCIAWAGKGSDRKALYAAFFGASRLLERRDEDARRIMRTPSVIELRDPILPYISELENPSAPQEVVSSRFLAYVTPHETTASCILSKLRTSETLS